MIADRPPSTRTIALLRACSVVALIWVIVARISAPSDAWDQAQPAATSWTSDMLANGRWVLPIERGEHPTSKPPLYSWLAAPAVSALGFSSDFAHRLPSLLALVGCWAAIALIGARLGGEESGAIGWLASLAFVANYSMFKLGYLARPDMLLTLWLLLGWTAATALLLPARRDRAPWRRAALRGVFWSCVGLAALTKGPPAAVLPAYAIIGARSVTGSWRRAGAFGWWWGVPLALAGVGTWLVLVYQRDPSHLVGGLWGQEVFGRVTGTGSEGSGGRGPIVLLTRIVNMPAYYLVRFLPWSLPSIHAAVVLVRGRGPRDTIRRAWLIGAVTYIVLIVAFFSFSAGKRADYVVSAFGPGSLLAAWWLARGSTGLVRAFRAATPAMAGVVLLACTVYGHREQAAPVRGFGDEISRFIDDAGAAIAEHPRPVAFWRTGESHLQAYLGFSEVDGKDAVLDLLRAGDPFWAIVGSTEQAGWDFSGWLAARSRSATVGRAMEAREVCRSADLPTAGGWRGRVILYLVEPADGS